MCLLYSDTVETTLSNMVYNSNKSWRAVLNILENLLKGMEEHLSKEPVVDFNDIRNGENILNIHVRKVLSLSSSEEPLMVEDVQENWSLIM